MVAGRFQVVISSNATAENENSRNGGNRRYNGSRYVPENASRTRHSRQAGVQNAGIERRRYPGEVSGGNLQ